MMSMRTMIFGCALSLAIAPLSWGQSASAKVAQRIGAILDPAGKDGGVISSPQSRVGPAKIERPEATLPLADAAPPLAPLPEKKSPQPRLSPEPSPLAANVGAPAAPQPTVLPAGPLAKQLAANPQVAAPLPILGVQVRDRISVADPSMEISALSILREQKPQRLNAVAFSPWNLPDPFENAIVIRLRELWAEEPMPPLFVTPPTGR